MQPPDSKSRKTTQNAFLTSLLPEADVRKSVKPAKKNNAQTTSSSAEHSPDPNAGKMKIIYYIENGKKYPIDFTLPLTLEAASQLGIAYEDCIKKSKDEYITSSIDRKLQELKYEHHCKRITSTIRSLFYQIEDLSKSALFIVMPHE